ncbi:MAG: hypothetical protein CMH46_14075 [Muricauda sp.]|nr:MULTISPECIES: hypothetical protein [unclassified Allomuricauda]MAU16651.1 hypothetical protein [Allomuricauda sp.]|tara:strand:+ start:460 stop:1134 length:675 start_codon:yes stop_codon:yes gene_type:complete
MNELILFKNMVNKHLRDRLKKEKWSGVCPVFYKNDVPNLAKCIEIRGSLKENYFICCLTVYSDFKLPNTPKSIKTKKFHTYKRIFQVGLTPNKVSSSFYQWALKDDKDFNIGQIQLLGEAISTHGTGFFNRFNNFPEPFLSIEPEDFDTKEVKLFNQYDVSNQVFYMNFLKEVHLSVDQIEKATAFSNLALARCHDNLKGNKIIRDKPNDKYTRELVRFFEMPK